MADPFDVWYVPYMDKDYAWYISLSKKNRKYVDTIAEDAWQAGYEQGRADILDGQSHTPLDPTV